MSGQNWREVLAAALWRRFAYDTEGREWEECDPEAAEGWREDADALLPLIAEITDEAVEKAVKRHVEQLVREKHQARAEGAAEVREGECEALAAALVETDALTPGEGGSAGLYTVHEDDLAYLVGQVLRLRAALGGDV